MDLLIGFFVGAMVLSGWVAYQTYRNARNADHSRTDAMRLAKDTVVSGAVVQLAGGPTPPRR